MGDAGRHHRHRSFGSRDLENSGSDASGYFEDNDRDDGTREWDSRADSYSVRSDDPVSPWTRTGVLRAHAPPASLRDPPLRKRSVSLACLSKLLLSPAVLAADTEGPGWDSLAASSGLTLPCPTFAGPFQN